ncbi:hypothetical protein R0623_003776 [Morganella morganii]|nr:hypothetical protein [Morganella morganii]
MAAGVYFKVPLFGRQHNQIGIVNIDSHYRWQAELLTDNRLYAFFYGLVVRQHGFQRRGDIFDIRLSGIVQQCFQCVFRRYNLADIYRVLGHRIETFQLPGKAAFIRQAASNIFDTNLIRSDIGKINMFSGTGCYI